MRAAPKVVNAANSNSNNDALAVLIATRDALDKAFDAAMSVDDMKRIARANQAVIDEILRLNALDIQALGQQYKPALTDLQGAIADLKAIQADIKKITSSLRTAAEVISAITKLLPLLGL